VADTLRGAGDPFPRVFEISRDTETQRHRDTEKGFPRQEGTVQVLKFFLKK
jgi:hypothetical protein